MNSRKEVINTNIKLELLSAQKAPPLIWVSEFEFERALSLDACYAKLSDTTQRPVEITEVLSEGKIIHFAATKSLKLGKWCASADLKGKVYIDETGGLAHVHCWVGESIYPTAIGILIFVLLVVGFNIFYFRSNILIVGIFALITLLPTAIVSLSSIEMKRELKTDIIRLFDGETAPLKHPLIP